MNLRCTYCQTPFTLGRMEKLAAIQKLQAENLHHYDAICPRCRRATPVSIQRLEIFTPGWQDGLKTLEADAANLEKSRPPEPVPAAEPDAKPAPVKPAAQPKAESKPAAKSTAKAKSTTTKAATAKATTAKATTAKTATKSTAKPAAKTTTSKTKSTAKTSASKSTSTKKSSSK